MTVPLTIGQKAQAVSAYHGAYNKHGTVVLPLGTSGKWDDYNINFSSILKVGEVWYGYYSGRRTTDNSGKIGLATSSDGISWTKYGTDGIIFEKNPTGGCFDSNEISHGYVWYENSIFKMVYTGSNGSSHQIGYATSSDGLSWTRYSNDPILTNGVPDSIQMMVGNVRIKNGVYYLYYSAQDGSGTAADVIMLAYGTDITALTKHGVVLSGATEPADDVGVLEPHVKDFGDKTYMFYQGDNNVNPENFTCLLLAVSTDNGFTFERVSSISPVLYPTRNKFDTRWNETPFLVDMGDGTWRLYYGGCKGLDDTSNWLIPSFATFVPGKYLQFDLSLLDNEMWSNITTAENIAIYDVDGGDVKANRYINAFDKENKSGFLYVENANADSPAQAQFKIVTGADINESNSTTPFTNNNILMNFEYDEASGTPTDLTGNFPATTITGTQNQTGLLGKAAKFDATGEHHEIGNIPALNGATTVEISCRIKLLYTSYQNGYIWAQANIGVGLFFSVGGIIRLLCGGVGSNSADLNNQAAFLPWRMTEGTMDSEYHQFVGQFDLTKTGNSNKLNIEIDGYSTTCEYSGTIGDALEDNTGRTFYVGEYTTGILPAAADVDNFMIRTSFNYGDGMARWNNVKHMSTGFWALGSVEEPSAPSSITYPEIITKKHKRFPIN